MPHLGVSFFEARYRTIPNEENPSKTKSEGFKKKNGTRYLHMVPYTIYHIGTMGPISLRVCRSPGHQGLATACSARARAGRSATPGAPGALGGGSSGPGRGPRWEGGDEGGGGGVEGWE